MAWRMTVLTAEAAEPRTVSGEVLDVDGASKLLGVHPVTVRKLAAEGSVPARKVGRAWRFSRAALHHWLMGDVAATTPENAQETRARSPAPRRSAAVLAPPSRARSGDLLQSQRGKKKPR